VALDGALLADRVGLAMRIPAKLVVSHVLAMTTVAKEAALLSLVIWWRAPVVPLEEVDLPLRVLTRAVDAIRT
jgi:hypothetical protein